MDAVVLRRHPRQPRQRRGGLIDRCRRRANERFCDAATSGVADASEAADPVAERCRESRRRACLRLERFCDNEEDAMQIGYARVSTDDRSSSCSTTRCAPRAATRSSTKSSPGPEHSCPAGGSNPNLSSHQVAAQLGVHRATLYRSLARSRRCAS